MYLKVLIEKTKCITKVLNFLLFLLFNFKNSIQFQPLNYKAEKHNTHSVIYSFQMKQVNNDVNILKPHVRKPSVRSELKKPAKIILFFCFFALQSWMVQQAMFQKSFKLNIFFRLKKIQLWLKEEPSNRKPNKIFQTL